MPVPMVRGSGRLYQVVGVTVTTGGGGTTGAGATTGVGGGIVITGVGTAGFLAAISLSLMRTRVPTGNRRICRLVLR